MKIILAMATALSLLAAPAVSAAPCKDPKTGKFVIKRCTSCGEAHYFPRAICPLCFSDKTEWEESSGEGEIYTYSHMRKSATGPYVIAYVTLKEGPSVQTNFVDCDFAALKIGQKVKVVFKPTDGAPLPFFTPV